MTYKCRGAAGPHAGVWAPAWVPQHAVPLLIDQRFKAVNVCLDDPQAAAPEVCTAHVDAEARRQLWRVAHAGRRQQFVVARLELRWVVLVARIQSQPEQKAEHVRVVVEKGAIVM